MLFSRTPRQEARAKLWLKGRRARYNTDIARWMLAKSKRLLAGAPYPIFHITEKEQHGCSFGERFAASFQQLFCKGYDAVVSIGSDAPAVEEIDWCRIDRQLAGGGAVLGPDFRGGCYLLGLHRRTFDKERFTNIPWQSNQVAKALLRYFRGRAGGEPLLLSRSRDINKIADLERVIPVLRIEASLWLRQLLFGLQVIFQEDVPSIVLSYTDVSISLRGPPDA